MAKNKGGRKPLGKEKRTHALKIRLNESELEQVRSLVASYHLDVEQRGVVGPFLRRMILQGQSPAVEQLPDKFSQLVFEINKIGANINQVVKVIHYKNKRSPNAKLDAELERTNELLLEIVKLLHTKTAE